MNKPLPIYLLVLTAFIFIGIYTTSFFKTYDKISEKFRLNDNNIDFLESSSSFVNNLKDAERGQRGYLLSNDEAYLIPYNDAIYRLGLEKERFFEICKKYGLTSKNDKSLKELSSLVDLKLDEMDQTIKLNRAGDNKEMMKIIKTDVGLNYMDKIEDIVRNIYAKQNYQKTQTMQSLMVERTRFVRLTILMSAGCFLLFLTIGLYVVYHSMKTRRLTQIKLNPQNQNLTDLTSLIDLESKKLVPQ